MFNYLLYASHCFRCWDCKIIKQDLLLCRLTYKEKERYEHCKAKPNGEKEDMQKISMIYLVCVCAKSLQLRPTLCDPMDCSQPGSSVHGILQQGYWSGLPFPSPGHLPDPGIKTASPALAGELFVTRATWEAPYLVSFGAFHSRIHWWITCIKTYSSPKASPHCGLCKSLLRMDQFSL